MMKAKSSHWKQSFIVVLLVAILVGCGNSAGSNSVINLTDDILNDAFDGFPDNDAFDGFPDEVGDIDLPKVGTIDLDDQPKSSEQIVNDLLGSINAGVYTNEVFGISCQIDSDWIYYTGEELEKLSQATLDFLTDPDVAIMSSDELEESSINGIAMLACSPDGLSNINFTVDRLSAVEANLMIEDKESILPTLMERILAASEQMGYTDCSAEIGVIKFLGGEHSVITTEGYFDDVPTYTTQVIIVDGQNFATINVTCFVEDITDDILSWFYTTAE